MSRPARVLLLFLISFATLPAQDLSLSLLHEGSSSVTPPSQLTLILHVSNAGTDIQGLRLETSLPPGWMRLTEDPPFDLPTGGAEIIILPLYVPSSTPTGHHELFFKVVDGEGRPLVEVSTMVLVMSSNRIEVTVLDCPLVAKAGTSYTITYSVANKGNAPVELIVSGNSHKDLPFSLDLPDSGKLELEPGGISLFHATLSVSPDIRDRFHHTFILYLKPSDRASTRQEAMSVYAKTEIIPLISGKTFETYVIPGSASVKVGGNTNSIETTAADFSLSLNGGIDRQKKHRIKIDLTKRLVFADPAIDHPADSYSFKYSNKHLSISGGDISVASAPLAGGQGMGFGLSSDASIAMMKAGTMGFGGFLYGNRRDPTAPLEVGGYGEYLLPKNEANKDMAYSLKLFVTSTIGRDLVLDLLQHLKLNKEVEFGLELSQGNALDGAINPAVRATSNGTWNRWFYKGDVLLAAPGFPELVGENLTATAVVGASFLERELTVIGTYEHSSWVLGALGPSGNDLGTNTGRVQASYSGFTGIPLASMLQVRRRIDASEPRQTDDISGDLHFDAGYSRLENAIFNAAMDFRLTENYLGGIIQFLQSYSLDMSARAGNQFTLSGGLSLKATETWGSLERTEADILLKAGARYVAKRGYVGINLRNPMRIVDGALSDILADIGVTGRYIFPWKHFLDASLSVLFGKRAGDDSSRLSFSLTYAAPFGINMKEKIETGLMKIRVFNDEDGQPLKDVIVRLGKAAVVTDASGMAVFRVAKPGSYFIYVDRGTLPLGYMSRTPLPMQASIELQKEVEIPLAITKIHRLEGRIRYYDFDTLFSGFYDDTASPESLQTHYVERADLPDQIVQLTNGDDKRILTTGTDGSFLFDELYSGTWTLSLSADRIPPNHYAKPPRVVLEIGDGHPTTAYIAILPEVRRIFMTQDLGNVAVIVPETLSSPNPSTQPTQMPRPSSTPAPTPTPTLGIFSTPTPPPSGSPASTPMPTPEASPAPTVVPQASPLPTKSPQASATPKPTTSPSPLPTLTPRPSASASATPKPRPTPSPIPSASPRPTPFASPMPIPVSSPRPSARPSPSPASTPGTGGLLIPLPSSSATPNPLGIPDSTDDGSSYAW